MRKEKFQVLANTVIKSQKLKNEEQQIQIELRRQQAVRSVQTGLY